MKFLGFYTPERIKELCKEGMVRVKIEVVDRVGEETIYFENGEQVIRIEEKILHMSGREIRSWRDIISIDTKDEGAMFLTDKEKESLK